MRSCVDETPVVDDVTVANRERALARRVVESAPAVESVKNRAWEMALAV